MGEKTLLTLAFCLGGFGAFLGMWVFRHKTKHSKFKILVPIALILHIVAGAWIYAHDILPDISLFARDGFHANNRGAFFIACVIAAVLFDVKVEDIAQNNRYSGNYATTPAHAAWDFVQLTR